MSGPLPFDGDIINKINKTSVSTNYENLSLETLVFLVNAERLDHLQAQADKEFKELGKRQEQVSLLHKTLKKINALTDTKGDLDFSHDADLKSLIQQAKELGIEGVVDGKETYTKEEKDRLIENIKMTIEDLNIKNEMQLKKADRLTNEKIEAYNLIKKILDPVHSAKMQMARNIAK